MKKLAIMTAALLVAGFTLSQSANAADLAKAKAIYAKQCAKCHGKKGDGKTTMGRKLKLKDWTKADVQAALKDEAAIKAIKEGVKKDGKTRMKPAKNVTADDIKSLVAYIRSLKK